MQKFCCFPCSETPNMNIDIKCVSTCCGSSVSDSLNQENKAKEIVQANSNNNSCEEDFAKATCCCSVSRHPNTNSHQKEENNCEDE